MNKVKINFDSDREICSAEYISEKTGKYYKFFIEVYLDHDGFFYEYHGIFNDNKDIIDFFSPDEDNIESELIDSVVEFESE